MYCDSPFSPWLAGFRAGWPGQGALREGRSWEGDAPCWATPLRPPLPNWPHLLTAGSPRIHPSILKVPPMTHVALGGVWMWSNQEEAGFQLSCGWWLPPTWTLLWFGGSELALLGACESGTAQQAPHLGPPLLQFPPCKFCLAFPS